MTDTVEWDLAEVLVGMLLAHGVSVERKEDLVLVGPARTPARLWASTAESGRGVLMTVSAAAPGGTWLSDTWMGVGSTPSDAVRDGLQAFSRGTFHVLLAGLWGIWEEDQVEHEVISVGAHTWDAYVGAAVGRGSSGSELLLPEGFWGRLLETTRAGLERGAEACCWRWFVAAREPIIYEALLDGEPDAAGMGALRGLSWERRGEGYASRRLFWMAVRRLGTDRAPSRRAACASSLE